MKSTKSVATSREMCSIILKKNILNLTKRDLRNVNIVIHLASIANDPMGDIKQGITWEISCLATMKLIENAIVNSIKSAHASYKRFISASVFPIAFLAAS